MINHDNTEGLSRDGEGCPHGGASSSSTIDDPAREDLGTDDSVVRKLLESRGVHNYQTCATMELRGNSYLRHSGLSLMALGHELVALLAIFFLISGATSDQMFPYLKIGWMENSSMSATMSASDGRASNRLAASNTLGRSCISPVVIRKLSWKPNDQCTDLSMASWVSKGS